MSGKKNSTVTYIQEMFNDKFDESVINFVLAECQYNVETTVMQLLTLSENTNNHATGSTLSSHKLDGIDPVDTPLPDIQVPYLSSKQTGHTANHSNDTTLLPVRPVSHNNNPSHDTARSLFPIQKESKLSPGFYKNDVYVSANDIDHHIDSIDSIDPINNSRTTGKKCKFDDTAANHSNDKDSCMLKKVEHMATSNAKNNGNRKSISSDKTSRHSSPQQRPVQIQNDSKTAGSQFNFGQNQKSYFANQTHYFPTYASSPFPHPFIRPQGNMSPMQHHRPPHQSAFTPHHLITPMAYGKNRPNVPTQVSTMVQGKKGSTHNMRGTNHSTPVAYGNTEPSLNPSKVPNHPMPSSMSMTNGTKRPNQPPTTIAIGTKGSIHTSTAMPMTHGNTEPSLNPSKVPNHPMPGSMSMTNGTKKPNQPPTTIAIDTKGSIHTSTAMPMTHGNKGSNHMHKGYSHSQTRTQGIFADDKQKSLIILRGLPGSGKSTLARQLSAKGGMIISTDDFFTKRTNKYCFNPVELSAAHEWNQNRAKTFMEAALTPLIIDNTNTQSWEMKPYIAIGLKCGYKIEIREPDTWWKWNIKELKRRNTHGVTARAIEDMLERYEQNVTVDTIMRSAREPVPASKSDAVGSNREMLNEKTDGKNEATPCESKKETLTDTNEKREPRRPTPTKKTISLSANFSAPLDRKRGFLCNNASTSQGSKPTGVCFNSDTLRKGCDIPSNTVNMSNHTESSKDKHDNPLIPISSTESSMNKCVESEKRCSGETDMTNESTLNASVTSRCNDGTSCNTSNSDLHEVLEIDIDASSDTTPVDIIDHAVVLQDISRKGDGSKSEPDHCVLQVHSKPPDDGSLENKSISDNGAFCEQASQKDSIRSNHSHDIFDVELTESFTRENENKGLSHSGTDEEIILVPCKNSAVSEASSGSSDLGLVQRNACTPFLSDSQNVASDVEDTTVGLQTSNSETRTAITVEQDVHVHVLDCKINSNNSTAVAKNNKYDSTVSLHVHKCVSDGVAGNSSCNMQQNVGLNVIGTSMPDADDVMEDHAEIPGAKGDKHQTSVTNSQESSEMRSDAQLEVPNTNAGRAGKGGKRDSRIDHQDIDTTTTQDFVGLDPIITSQDSSGESDLCAAVESPAVRHHFNSDLMQVKHENSGTNHSSADVDCVTEQSRNVAVGKPLLDDNKARVEEDIHTNTPESSMQSSHSDIASSAVDSSNTLDPIEFLKDCFPHTEIDLLKSFLNSCDGDLIKTASSLLQHNESDYHSGNSVYNNSRNEGSVTKLLGVNSIPTAECKFKEVNASPKSQKRENDLNERSLNTAEDDRTTFNAVQTDSPSVSTPRKFQDISVDSLQLTLDPALALQLLEMFGAFSGVSAKEPLSESSRSIKIDKEFAKVLYTKWRKSIQATNKAKKTEGSKTSKLSPVPGLSESNKKTKYKTPPRQFYLPEHVQTKPAKSVAPQPEPVSLKEIMDEQLAVHVSQSDQEVEKRFFEEQLDLSTKLKRSRLHGMFPGVDAVALNEIFQANNYDLDTTIMQVQSSCGIPATAKSTSINPQPPFTVHHSPNSRQSDVQSYGSAELEESVDGNFQSLHDPSYKDYRAEAQTHFELRTECIKKAAMAYNKKQGELAKIYADQARQHDEKIKEANRRAAEKIIENRIDDLVHLNTLDLHELHVNEAVQVLGNVLDERRKERRSPNKRSPSYLQVITGRGNRSRDGIARIKPAVIDYLKRNGYRYEELNSGLYKVFIN